MRRLFGGIGWVGMTALFTALSLSAVPAAAEKREQTYVKKNVRSASKSVIPLGEGRELIQETLISEVKISNPDFKIKDEWTFNHYDLVNGSGSQRGYYVDTHEDGSQTFGSYEGTFKSVTNSDGTWEANWQGIFQYLGGTGKFKNLKGGGKYKGSASSSNPGGQETGTEIVEY